jgi:hypothetical protein
MPQAPFTSSPTRMPDGFHPPATGSPFRGYTTNQATTLGRRAPKTSAVNHYFADPFRRIASHSAIPQTPPQKASEMTCGTWNGAVGANE